MRLDSTRKRRGEREARPFLSSTMPCQPWTIQHGHILTFLVTLHNILTPTGDMSDADPQRKRYPTEPPPHGIVEGTPPLALCARAFCTVCGRGCDEMNVGATQGWMRRSRRSTLHVCQDFACDVDEVPWANQLWGNTCRLII